MFLFNRKTERWIERGETVCSLPVLPGNKTSGKTSIRVNGSRPVAAGRFFYSSRVTLLFVTFSLYPTPIFRA